MLVYLCLTKNSNADGDVCTELDVAGNQIIRWCLKGAGNRLNLYLKVIDNI